MKVGTFTSSASDLSASSATASTLLGAVDMYSVSDGRSRRHIGARLPPSHRREVDVILRPSEEAALATVDLTEIYGGEIVSENVVIPE